ncbi:hypothetical protein [Kineococcus sp. SYSU DK005]|uniref:hypothetical protein n=1 Tax=Kineococcus sp. SYSU DK005 TaxID=3383126 RepID=UPI003D7DC6EE
MTGNVDGRADKPKDEEVRARAARRQARLVRATARSAHEQASAVRARCTGRVQRAELVLQRSRASRLGTLEPVLHPPHEHPPHQPRAVAGELGTEHPTGDQHALGQPARAAPAPRPRSCAGAGAPAAEAAGGADTHLRAHLALARAMRVRQRLIELLLRARVTRAVSEFRVDQSRLEREGSVLHRLSAQLPQAPPGT